MNIHEKINAALDGAQLVDSSNIAWIDEAGDRRQSTQLVRDLLSELKKHGLTIVEDDPFNLSDQDCPQQGVLDIYGERLTKIEDWIDQEDANWQQYGHTDYRTVRVEG
jgi:hypothetical protein